MELFMCSPTKVLCPPMCRATLNNGVRISKRKHLCSRYTAVSSKPKTDATEIYSDACYLPPPGILKLQRPNATIDQTVTSDTSEDLGKVSRWNQHPNLRIKNFPREVLDENESFPSKKN
ncbi:hypothetical protein ACTXT7_008759 [Hymenolepis weldensis]